MNNKVSLIERNVLCYINNTLLLAGPERQCTRKYIKIIKLLDCQTKYQKSWHFLLCDNVKFECHMQVYLFRILVGVYNCLINDKGEVYPVQWEK